MKKYRIILLGMIVFFNCLFISQFVEAKNSGMFFDNDQYHNRYNLDFIRNEKEVKLIAVGDNLIHGMIIKSGLLENGTYDFNYMYDGIRDYIKDADIKAINQESVLVNDKENYSGYPVFGSPLQVGEAVYNAGFNIITQATNHTYDKKELGIENSIEFWKNKNNVLLLGINESKEMERTFKIKEFKGITFSFLNYTYGLNGFTLPKDKDYLVNTFMTEDKKKIMFEDIKSAAAKTDFTIVFIHWGNEYKLKENEYQQNLAYEIANAGADLIIGTHPHVIEPLKYIYTEDGRTVPVFYSLGNFISNQNDLYTMLGGLAEVNFIKDNNDCYVRSCKLVPLVTHISTNQKEYKTYLLDKYSEDIIKNHKLYKNGLTIKYLKDTFDSVYKEKD